MGDNADDTEYDDTEYETYEVGDEETVPRPPATPTDTDVFLDVPLLKVDEIDLDVEDLRAHVSLQAEVLDLLRLSVGADVSLGRVHLGISGVEAQAQLRVRLDNVAVIVNRVLTTVDRNPEILTELARGVSAAVRDVGGGAREAVGAVGAGAGQAVQDVGAGAGGAVRDVGRGAGGAVEEVGRGAGGAVRDVGAGAGGVGRTVEDVGAKAGQVVEGAGETVTGAAGQVADTTGRAATPARKATRSAAKKRTAAEGGTRTRRVRGEDGKLPPRPARRRAPAEETEEPP